MDNMKRAIIIGATSGLGREVARTLASQGVVVGVAGRRVERLVELQEEFGNEKVHIAEMDVTKECATEQLDSLISQVGEPDLLLYTSGIGKQNPELDPAIELNTVATNSMGMVRLVTHFLGYVKRSAAYNAKHKAHIAVITSVAGTKGMGSAPAYTATKSMQSSYLSALAQYARMYDIPALFSDIRPGFVATEILNPEKHYPMLMTPAEGTRHILKGLRRKKRIIIFDWRFRLLVLFWRLIPRCLWERMTFVKN